MISIQYFRYFDRFVAPDVVSSNITDYPAGVHQDCIQRNWNIQEEIMTLIDTSAGDYPLNPNLLEISLISCGVMVNKLGLSERPRSLGRSTMLFEDARQK